MISLKEARMLLRRLFEEGVGPADCANQSEVKSPPGPNLHKGGLSFSKRLYILFCPVYCRLYNRQRK
ncbi:MAG: hypothetical protein ACYSYU_02970 [Planctomycetota bacterium]